jgi:hypothetical protein
MVEDMFDLMQEQGEGPSPFKYLRNGDWFGGFQLFHSDARPHQVPYNPCVELGDNALLMKVIESAVKLTTAGATGSKINSINQPEAEKDGDEDDENTNEILQWMESFPSSARGSCSLLLTPAYLSDKVEDCQALFNSRTLTDFSVMLVSNPRFPSTNPLLFPNVTSLLLKLRDCDSVGESKSQMTITVIPTTELKLPVERVAYPGGRRPFQPFHREGSAGLENQQKGLNLDGTPIAATYIPRPEDPVFIRADKILKAFAVPSHDVQASEKRSLVYRVRWYMYVYFDWTKHRLLFAWSYPGYAYSVRRGLCSAEQQHRYETYLQGEHCMEMDFFEDVLSWNRVASTHYVSSILEPSVRRVMEHSLMTLQLKNHLKTAQKSLDQIFAFDFSIDTHLKPKLIRVQAIQNKYLASLEDLSLKATDDVDEDEEELPVSHEHMDVEGISLRVLKKLKKAQLRLKRVVSVSPFYFARARRGDAFETFRMVYNELQEIRRPDNFHLEPDACQDSFPSYKDLKFAIELENIHLKQKNVIHRDLNKRLWKKWSQCRYKMKDENKRKCMLGLLKERYRLIVRKLHLLSDEDKWVSETLQSLMEFSKSKRPGSGDDDDDEGGGGRRKRDDGALDV